MQRGGAGVGGLSHPTATINDGGQTIATSAAAAPLQHSYGSAPDLKTGKGVDVSPGMRSRINADTETLPQKVQAGVDCLAQAVKN
jgi:hypothetical protein